MLASLVPAAGLASQEHRDIVDGVDFRVSSVAECHNQAVIEERAGAFLNSIQFNKEVPEGLHHQACKQTRLWLVAELGIGRLVMGDLVIDLALAGDIGF